jgi:HKD family nuclease
VAEQVRVLKKVQSGEKFQMGGNEVAAVLMLQQLVSQQERKGEHEAFYTECFKVTGSRELAVFAAIDEATRKRKALQPSKKGQTLQVIRGIPEKTPQFFTGGLMLPVMLLAFEEMTESFVAWCYQIDQTELCNLLVSKLLRVHDKTEKKCKGRIIFDKDNFFYSSCARQAARVEELFKAGCEMRTYKPRGSNFACMHTKTWIIDEETIYTGSVNLTHNGMENNKEHLWKIQGEKAVVPLKEDFEELWLRAELVTAEHIARMKTTDAKRKLKRSDSAPVNRSLCEAMEEAR